MKIGIYGGAFDPVHRGHLEPADAVARKLQLDCLYYVPSRRSPFPEKGHPTDSRHRVAMLALALAGREDRIVSLCELDAPEPSYTIDTVRTFRRSHPGDSLHLLMGADALAGLPRWKDPDEIARACRICAFPRQGEDLEAVVARPELVPFRSSILIFDEVRVKISSTDVREAAARGESLAGRTPAAVEEYIRKQGLYRQSGNHPN